MLSTNTANRTTTIIVYWTVIATTKKNNTDFLLLVGNTIMYVLGGLCTNSNTAACPSDWGWAVSL